MPFDSSIERFIGFFEREVLAFYSAQTDKYCVATDNFEGKVETTSEYYERMTEDERGRDYLDVRFGFRTLKNGELKIAAFLPDLLKSKRDAQRWRGFLVTDADWLGSAQDERFSLWVRRAFEGDWSVDNGPAFNILDETRLLNGLTLEAVGQRLYEVEDASLTFPTADNTHRYEDAHLELYRVLLDGLSRPCITALGQRLAREVKAGDKYTFTALKNLLPQLETSTTFTSPFANVIRQRGLAGHKVRRPAQPMGAFSAFAVDLQNCLEALRLLRSELEKELGMDAKKAEARQEALKWLPQLGRPVEAGYAVSRAKSMIGKTIERVEVGFRKDYPEVHVSEAIIVHFTDGSIMGIDTGYGCDGPGDFRPDDLRIDLKVTWVPPKQ